MTKAERRAYTGPWWCRRHIAARDEPVLVRFAGNRRASLAVMRRLLALEHAEPRLLVEVYGCNGGEAYRVSWIGEGEMPEGVMERIHAAIQGRETEQTSLF